MFSAISAIATVTCPGNAVAPTGWIWLLFFTAVPLLSVCLGGPPLETCRVVGVGRLPRHTNSKGTAVKKSNQIQPVGATPCAIPERVNVSMSEIAENMQEDLLALTVGPGLQVMQALMDADVTALAGPKGRHDQARTAVRHGRERGSVTLGGRRVAVTRPRVRAADGSGELPVASYELFTSTEILGTMALE